MSEALKSNTTLTILDLGGEDKGNNTQMASANNPLFSIHKKSSGSWIRDTGATSLSDALKSNKTLTKLNLRGEHKKKQHTNDIHQIFFFFFFTFTKSTDNDIEETGATSLSEALKSNTTLTKLYLGCEDKRNNTQMASINNPLFSILIKSTANMIGGMGATSMSEALKSNTTLIAFDLIGEDK